MAKTGILLHVYHLEVLGWERLVWGDPAKDELGTLTKFVDCLLDIPADEQVISVTYGGPSLKDGLSEGAYTRRYLLERIDQLDDFSRLKRKMDRLSPKERAQFAERLKSIAVGHPTLNTITELEGAAHDLAKAGVDKVLQIAAASHGPRCIKLQGVARAQGLIPKDQQWFTVISDTCFNGGDPSEVAISEPPHRADDPLFGIHPSLPDVLQHFYYDLHGNYRRDALLKIDQVIADVRAAQPNNDTTA